MCQSVVDTVRNTDGTPTQKLIAVLQAAGITDTAELAQLIGVGLRAIQKANSSSQRTTVREPQFAKRTTVRQNEPQFANSSSPLARAYKESPTEIDSPEEVKKEITVCAVASTTVIPMPTNPRATGTAPRQRGSSDEFGVKFEQFWSVFPVGRKRGKGKCRELFVVIATGKHRKLRATADEMINAARVYAAKQPDPQYVPMPETWLNQGRWEDNPADSIEAPAARIREPASQYTGKTLEKFADIWG